MTNFAFHTAFLMALAWVAEGGFILPVRMKRVKPLRFFTPVTAQNLPHGTAQIVVAQALENPAKIAKGIRVRF
jgi:hypothetical protein